MAHMEIQGERSVTVSAKPLFKRGYLHINDCTVKCKGKVVPVLSYAMKAYGGVDV
jgi:hypothetical protein